jgi:hypothetical protein
MYTDVPKSDDIIVITDTLKTNSEIDEINQKAIIHTLKMMMEQNYFSLTNNITSKPRD